MSEDMNLGEILIEFMPREIVGIVLSFFRPPEEDYLDMIALYAQDIRGNWEYNVNSRIDIMQELANKICRFDLSEELDKLRASACEDGRALRDFFSGYGRDVDVDFIDPLIFWPNSKEFSDTSYVVSSRSDREDEYD